MAKNLKPYGDVPYADPGYQTDGVHRYPLSTKGFVKAGWSFINQAKNQKPYTAEQLTHIKNAIKSAAKRFGITISEEETEFVDLAYRGIPMFLPESRSFPAQFEIRSMGNGKIELTGYASTVERPYRMFDQFGEYTETVRAGAFSKTIAANADTAFLANHTGLTLARTKTGSLKMSEDSTGLLTVAELDERRTDARDLMLAVERGDVDEMSFGFRVEQQKWNDDYDQRSLIELNLDRGDVSAVNFGANPNTSVHAVQRAFGSVGAARIHTLASELRAGGDLSSSARQALSQVLDLVATADRGLDAAQPILADVLNIPNPDADDEKTTGKGPDEQESQKLVPLNRHMAKRMAKLGVQ